MRVTATVVVGPFIPENPKLGGRSGHVLATKKLDSIAEAEDWVSRNRETFRGALDDGEQFFTARLTDERGQFVCAIEVDGNAWGSDGVTTLGVDRPTEQTTTKARKR